MSDINTIDTMASAVVSAIQENNKINIEPKLKDVKTSVNKPDNQKEGDIWLDVQQTDSGSGEIENLDQTKILDMFYPVGSIYQSTNNFIDPNIKFGGTWQKLENVFLFASSSAYSLGAKGGEINHSLSVNEIPSHSHSPNISGHYFTTNLPVSTPSTARRKVTSSSSSSYYGMTATGVNDISETSRTTSIGGNQPHNNMPPYQVVHIWERIK